MAPPAPEGGIYTTLTANPLQIRLLQIEGDRAYNLDFDNPLIFRLSTFDLDHAPKYRCLSYVWGREEWHPIQVRITADGEYHTMHVSKNLHGFLRRMRMNAQNPNYPDGYLWVDAVCINQQSDAEKATIIPEMGKIYGEAGQVIAWLGWEWDRFGNAEDDGQNEHLDTEAPAEDAIDAIQEIANAFRTYKQDEGDPWSEGFGSFAFDQEGMHRMLQLRHFPMRTWTAIALFVQRVWYSRAWIVQEAVLARSLVIVCGLHVILWDDILQTSIFLQASGWYQHLVQLLASASNAQYLIPPGWQQILFASLRRRVHNEAAIMGDLGPYDQFDFTGLNTYEAFSVLLRAFRHFDATQPKDKIFAPLALLREIQRQGVLPFVDSSSLDVDYLMPVLELLRLTTGILLSGCRDLDLLSEIQDLSLNPTSRLTSEQLESLPSWVPDYSQTMIATFRDIPKVHFDALPGRLKRVELDKSHTILKVEGCLLGTIDRVAPEFSTTLWKKDFRELLTFASTLGQTYFNGQDRMEVFARTMIVDLSDEDMDSAFKRYLQMTTAILLHGDGSKDTSHQAEETITDWSPWAQFDDLYQSSSVASTLVPDVKDLISFTEEWRQAMLDGKSGLTKARNLSKPSARYANAVGRACIHRRMFVTEQGYLGLGPHSMEVGDQIWFLSGAHVPFVLRPILVDGVESGFRLVGETYVHGYMHGQILEDKDNDDFIELVIR